MPGSAKVYVFLQLRNNVQEFGCSWLVCLVPSEDGLNVRRDAWLVSHEAKVLLKPVKVLSEEQHSLNEVIVVCCGPESSPSISLGLRFI